MASVSVDAALPAVVNGCLVPAGEASVPVLDEGFLRGDGAFEVVLLYEGHPFELEDHLRRLSASCRSLSLECPLDLLTTDIGTVVEHCPSLSTSVMRIVVTRGGVRVVFVQPHLRVPAVSRLMPVAYQPQPMLAGSKSLSYATNMQALRAARAAGFDDALLVTQEGRVLEAQTASVFWATSAGELCTPPLSDGILDSITRRVIGRCVKVVERSCSLETISAASEVFLAGTAREIQAVSAVGEVQLPPAPGPVTQRAQEAFMRYVASSTAPVRNT